MKFTSQDFQNGEQIPSDCTCDGINRSPQLTWSDFPAETKSFVIFCDDPDASGGRWVHWIVVNIPLDITSIIGGHQFDDHGIEIENSFNKITYGGPCPPTGEHRYIFTVYALSVATLTNVNRADLEKQVEPHILDKAELIGLYSRSII